MAANLITPLSVTIITNTIRRDRELVEKSLRSSLAQAGDPHVVLVDQNPIPLALSPEVMAHPRFSYQHHVIGSVSGARNFAKYPTSEWLLFCDDDGYMASDYLQKFYAHRSRYANADIVCGSIKRIDNGDFYSARHRLGGDLSKFWNTKILMGSNFMVKREVFEELGKFDPRFGAGAKYGSSEETDFAWNAFFAGKKMTYDPELVVFHVPPFEGAFFPELKKAYRYGRGKGALVRKWFLRGHVSVLIELFEMLLLPVVRSLQFLLTLQFKEVGYQVSAACGRLLGLFT